MEDGVATGDGGEEGGEVGDVAEGELEVGVLRGGERREVAGAADESADRVAMVE